MIFNGSSETDFIIMMNFQYKNIKVTNIEAYGKLGEGI